MPNFTFMHFTFYSIIRCESVHITHDSPISPFMCDAYKNYMGHHIPQHKGQEGTSPALRWR